MPANDKLTEIRIKLEKTTRFISFPVGM
jgi:hypothetical protein